MNTRRYRSCTLTVALLAIGAMALQGCAATGAAPTDDDYPDGPITYVVPYNPGGSSDPVGREFARILGGELGTTVVVENLPGGDETIGITSVIESDPDGQTIGMTSAAGIVFGPLVTSDLSYHDVEDYAPLAMMVRSPNAVFVRKDSPYMNIEDFIKAAKDAPGEVSIGTIGRMTVPTFNIVSLEDSADIDLNIVPFSGGASEAVGAALSGQIDAFVSAASGQIGLVKSGDLRALAHTGDDSYDGVLPGSVSFDSLGYDVPFSVEYLNVAPAGMPDSVREKLTDTAYRIVESDEWQKFCEDNGLQAVSMKGDELNEWIDDVTERGQRAIALVEESGL